MLGFPIDQIKSSGDGNILKAANFSRFWASEKLKLNWLTKRKGSDSFPICSEWI